METNKARMKVKIKHIRLRRKIIQVLKMCQERDMSPPSANALLDMLIDAGLSQNIIAGTGRIAQVCRSTVGVIKEPITVCNSNGDAYTAFGYTLESEDAFNEWVESKVVQ